MSVHRLFIGANNVTKECEVDKVSSLVSLYFPGFTIVKSQGHWKGTKEDSIVVEIETEEVAKLKDLTAVLKSKLSQEAIGYQVLPSMSFV